MTQITREQFDNFHIAVKTSFQGAFDNVTVNYTDIAEVIPSSGKGNAYDWLGEIPDIREWIGDRVLNEVGKHGYYIKNKKFEGTIRVNIDDIDDGDIGQYGVLSRGIGKKAANFPQSLVFKTLKAGFNELCYDGQNFFDTDHPVTINDEDSVVSNMQAGANEPWFLLDTTQIIKPIIFQERLKPEFSSLDADTNTQVFMKDEYAFGTKQRCNTGYGFWQMAFGSKAPLTETNLKAARKKMRQLKNNAGESLGIVPNVLVVGSSNEDIAEKLINAEKISGEYNTIKGKYALVVSAFLDD